MKTLKFVALTILLIFVTFFSLFVISFCDVMGTACTWIAWRCRYTSDFAGKCFDRVFAWSENKKQPGAIKNNPPSDLKGFMKDIRMVDDGESQK